MINSGFLSLCILAFIHIMGSKLKIRKLKIQKMLESLASGALLSYLFIDLLPALEKGQAVLKRSLGHVTPYLETHANLVALIGILFYSQIESSKVDKKMSLLKVSGYLIFNFIVGSALSDSQNPEIRPLSLFTIAIGFYYLINDSFYKSDNKKWIRIAVVLSLASGYILSMFLKIPDLIIATGVSFASGSVFLNIFKHEFLNSNKRYSVYFILGALIYGSILIFVGN